MKKVSNVAANHEVFEVHWSHTSQTIQIYRLRNLLQKKSVHVIQDKSQVDNQMRPIRLKHGSVNPSKAQNMKLSLPPQLIYLTHEDHHSFVERMQIYPSKY